MPQTTETLSLGLDSSPMLRGFRMASAASDKFTKSFTKNMRAVAMAGRAMTMKLTVPIVSALTISGKSWVDFQDQMVKSTAIMSGVTADLRAEMEATAKALSEQGPKSAAELAESYFFLASAGMDASQSISALSVVMRFATAGAFDMATATDLLTDAQSALGLASKDAAENQLNLLRISDVFVKANTLANSSVRQISEAMTNDGAAAADELGQSMETTTALLSAYADKGKKGAVAGSMLGRAFRLTAASARENAAAFQKYNIRVVDATTGEYRNFIDILDDMNVAFAGMTKPQIGAALKDLGIETLAQKALTPLLGLTDKLKAYESALRSAGGTTQDVFEKQMESPLNKLKVLMNTFQNTTMALIDSWAFWPLVALAALGPFALAIAGITFVVTQLSAAYGLLTGSIWLNTIATKAASVARLAFNVALIVSTGLLHKNSLATTLAAARAYLLTSATWTTVVAFTAMAAKLLLVTAALVAGYLIGQKIRKLWSDDAKWEKMAGRIQKVKSETEKLNEEFSKFSKLSNVGETGISALQIWERQAELAKGVTKEMATQFNMNMRAQTGEKLQTISDLVGVVGSQDTADELLQLRMLFDKAVEMNAATGTKETLEAIAARFKLQTAGMQAIAKALTTTQYADLLASGDLEAQIKVLESVLGGKGPGEAGDITSVSATSAQKATLAVAGSIEAYRAERQGKGPEKVERAVTETASNTAETNKILKDAFRTRPSYSAIAGLA